MTKLYLCSCTKSPFYLQQMKKNILPQSPNFLNRFRSIYERCHEVTSNLPTAECIKSSNHNMSHNLHPPHRLLPPLCALCNLRMQEHTTRLYMRSEHQDKRQTEFSDFNLLNHYKYLHGWNTRPWSRKSDMPEDFRGKSEFDMYHNALWNVFEDFLAALTLPVI